MDFLIFGLGCLAGMLAAVLVRVYLHVVGRAVREAQR